jgi:hypothetical protein
MGDLLFAAGALAGWAVLCVLLYRAIVHYR